MAKKERTFSSPKVFLKKNLKFILLTLILMIFFNQYIVRIGLMLLFTILGVYSLQVTRVMPYISIESISASAVVIGYLYGWQTGLVFGLVAGLIGYINISLVNLLSITMTLFIGLSGVLAALFAAMGWDFVKTFIVIFLIRAVIGYPVMETVNPNPPKNIMHAVGDSLFNIFITIHIMKLIVDLLNWLNLK